MKKRIKPYLLVLLVCVAAGLCFAGETWAWPTAALVGKDHLSIGRVGGTLKLRQEDQELSAQAPLIPGEYEAELVSSEDAEGWFVLRLTATESDTEPKVCRTEVMAPGESIHFHLHLAETAVLTLEGRWDPVDEEMEVFAEGDMVFWGQSVPDETEPETEEIVEETEAPATEATETETEAPATEATETETEAPATEATEAETEAPATEETETETEAPAMEETEPKTENPTTEETEAETESPTTEPTDAPTEPPATEATEAVTEVPESGEAAA